MTQEGWRCPACGSVYAPWMAKCSTCPAPDKVISRYPINPECDHRWDIATNGSDFCRRCGGTR
jgi:predicted ATP-dependent serine protease